jgi:hypothetical protein
MDGALVRVLVHSGGGQGPNKGSQKRLKSDHSRTWAAGNTQHKLTQGIN